MNKNLPQKYKESIFHKIINKFKLLFFTNKQIEDIDITTNNTNIQTRNSFIEQTKVKYNVENIDNNKKRFMENLSKNPELLKGFSNDRLEKILQYYLDENNKKREMLKRLTT